MKNFNLVIQNKDLLILVGWLTDTFKMEMIGLLIIISSFSPPCFGTRASTAQATLGASELEVGSRSNWCSLWGGWTFPVARWWGIRLAVQEGQRIQVPSLPGRSLPWKIPWTEEPGIPPWGLRELDMTEHAGTWGG